MKLNRISALNLLKPAVVAVCVAASGLALWQMPLGERWVRSSYDYIFRFGTRAVTNKVVLIQMDNEAFSHERRQERRQPWDRQLHARLLERLAADNCPLVVFDSFFGSTNNAESDNALARAMGKLPQVVLMAKQTQGEHPDLLSVRPMFPDPLFLRAVRMTNAGVAWLAPDLDGIVRQHWPFPAPGGPYRSLPWVAAEISGALLPETPHEQWLRYYGSRGSWKSFSYYFAFNQATNYFADKVVFIGNKPATPLPDGEDDEFRTPYTRWTNESVGGVEILITEYLNLMNGSWLRRAPWWLELLVLLVSGIVLGAGLMLIKPIHAVWCVGAVAVLVLIGAVCLSYYTNYWFPWLIIVGGQLPIALGVALLSQIRLGEPYPTSTPVIHVPAHALVKAAGVGDLPDAPDYHIVPEPFAEGAYGKVWLVQNAVGQWQALKAIYQAKFVDNVEPYEREFRGITSYKPLSGDHPGLLRVDFVSMQKPQGYFYYVMELGDSQVPDWQENPRLYRPRDLFSVRAHAPARRLSVGESVEIVLPLTEALGFLHDRELTHRDIKPQNIIFVNGRPKLADVGLVAKVRGRHEEGTYIGTPGYMPPAPETPGTREADIYGLGMVLYVISTGCDPAYFPELSTGLIARTGEADFIRLNSVILKACHQDRERRYSTVAEFRAALLELQKTLQGSHDHGSRGESVMPIPTKPVEGI